jgi:hypothetical protein
VPVRSACPLRLRHEIAGHEFGDEERMFPEPQETERGGARKIRADDCPRAFDVRLLSVFDAEPFCALEFSFRHHPHDGVGVEGVMTAEVLVRVRLPIAERVELHHEIRESLGHVDGAAKQGSVRREAFDRYSYRLILDVERLLDCVGMKFDLSSRSHTGGRSLSAGRDIVRAAPRVCQSSLPGSSPPR